MQIEGIAGSAFKEVAPKQQQTQSVGGAQFMEAMNNVASRADVVVRGNFLGAPGLSSKKMVNDSMSKYDFEEEESLEDIFSKINRIDELLKEHFSK